MCRISFPSSPLSLSTLRLLRQPAQRRTEKRRRHGYLLSRRRSAKNFSHAVSSHRHRAEVPEDVTLRSVTGICLLLLAWVCYMKFAWEQCRRRIFCQDCSGPPLPLSLSICLPFKDRRRRCRRGRGAASRRCNAASSLIEIVKRESIPPCVRSSPSVRRFYRTKEPHNITSQKEGRNCRCKRPERDIQASHSLPPALV